MSTTRQGLTLGVTAYILWGVFPLYFPLLEPASAGEILAHRIVWSAGTMLLAVLLLRRGPAVLALVRDRRARLRLAPAALVISLNWVTYVWGVNNGHVVETALGYFINPLVTVLMGVVIFGERLRRTQWLALSGGAAAVVVLGVQYGAIPWVSLVLAFSFGTYGLLKKQANAGAVESLTFETVLLSPFALLYLVWISTHGVSDFAQHGSTHALLLASLGIVTAVPLLCFSAAATRISMTALGLLQYLGPTIQFLLGVFWFHEPMPLARFLGFALVWGSLAIFTAEGLRHRRRQLRDAAEAAAL